jgi:hypothetical protein
MNNLLIPKKERHFLPNTIEINWKTILPFFDDLMNRELISLGELTQWMIDRSELESVLEEDFAWRYIRMTCDTTDEKILKAFEDFATNIEPKLAEYANLLNQKIMDCDLFIVLSHCQFEKNGYQNRFMMKEKWRTMSVNKGLENIYESIKKEIERFKIDYIQNE